ncbi:hypothetical protein [uncultured Treponema sp.]|uniref:hypothetical protein n=1 Tax=uncultured Treponema sp. TaxID=162155 RepID=UPI002592A244|nr:hypothetical protein [uncultured Treponema sp.]
MSVFDYILPHRLLINKSLRKEAESLKSKISTYHANYENMIQVCQIEIRNKEQEKDKEYESVKNKLSLDLQKTKSVFDELGKKLMQYADEFLQHKCLKETLKLMLTEKSLLIEDSTFLSNQLSLIREEIEILIDRQKELSTNTKVKDIIKLANLSGCDYGFSLEDDAKSLLEKINEKIKELDNSEYIVFSALSNLKSIVQERAEYLPLIKYINWLIKQKKQIITDLNKKKQDTINKLSTIKSEINELRGEITILEVSLNKLAKNIRYYWSKPITLIKADIAYEYQEKTNAIQVKQDKINEIKEVQNELRSLADMHSSDQDKWNTLKDRQTNLQTDINTMNEEIRAINSIILQKKNEQKIWFDKKNNIYNSLKNNNIYLLSDKNQKESDEERIISERLFEIKNLKEKRREGSYSTQEEEKLLLLRRDIKKGLGRGNK